MRKIPFVTIGVVFIFLLSILPLGAEPVWWTQQKRDCGLSPSLAYNDWVAQGSPCNKNSYNPPNAGNVNATNPGPSAEQVQNQLDQNKTVIAKEKAAEDARRSGFDADKNEALGELKDPSSDENDSPTTQKGPVVARIALCRGDIQFVTRDGHRVLGSQGTAVPMGAGTHIYLGKGAKLKLLLPDETVFTINGEGDMVLDEFVYDPTTTVGKFSATIAKGFLRWVSGKLDPNHRFDKRVNIPVGILGIRGTRFDLLVNADGTGYVKLSSGRLLLTEKKSGSKFNLKAGHKVRFGTDGHFSKPTVFKP